MTVKIGPREQALREMREAQARRMETDRAKELPAIREKIAAIPARKPKATKKKRL